MGELRAAAAGGIIGSQSAGVQSPAGAVEAGSSAAIAAIPKCHFIVLSGALACRERGGRCPASAVIIQLLLLAMIFFDLPPRRWLGLFDDLQPSSPPAALAPQSADAGRGNLYEIGHTACLIVC